MTRIDKSTEPSGRGALTLQASRDEHTGQIYVPPRALAADGSLRPTTAGEVPAQGVLYSFTTFAGECYGLVDLEGGARIQVLLEPNTTVIGARVLALGQGSDGRPRFRHG